MKRFGLDLIRDNLKLIKRYFTEGGFRCEMRTVYLYPRVRIFKSKTKFSFAGVFFFERGPRTKRLVYGIPSTQFDDLIDRDNWVRVDKEDILLFQSVILSVMFYLRRLNINLRKPFKALTVINRHSDPEVHHTLWQAQKSVYHYLKRGDIGNKDLPKITHILVEMLQKRYHSVDQDNRVRKLAKLECIFKEFMPYNLGEEDVLRIFREVKAQEIID